MSWLDALLGNIYSSGVQQALGGGVNFTAGLRAVFNPSTKQNDVSIAPSTITPDMSAPEASNRALMFALHSRYSFTAAAQDLALITSASFAFKIVRATMTIELGNSATLQVFDAISGGGTAFSQSASSGSTNQTKTGLVITPWKTVSVGTSLYLHTDGAGIESGDVLLECIRV